MPTKKPYRYVRVGGSFFGVSTRTDGKIRANFLVNPATGHDRAAVKKVKKVTRKSRRR
jgi:hypothetical protein